MSRLGPVITLAAGVVLAAGLGVASINAAPAADNTAANAAEAPSTEETTPARQNATESPATGNTAEPSAAPSPTEPKKIAKADYGGRVKGNGGLIAISIRNGKAIGYFCDGRTEAWFKGKESAGELSLAGFGSAKVTAALAGGKARGTVALGGKKWSFVAPTVVKPSGLYRATAIVRGAKLRAGWIVLKNPQGGFTQVGAAVLGEEQLDIPRLDGERPTTPLTVDGTTVYPKDVDGFIEEMS
ncbi:hypothetical protein FE391_25865 [Nonomuraea sp. KC401]|uniref:hypothetical protein n=1 Tax=unclassified Nonomuraea TaxID=2593643 RepID=UPI0010FEE0F5|nr:MULTISPECIES: hypothetical protein [unclassified Nonomuraea]NBE95971.1 hypothetical protein [Nonomuraea sp. K271]TLF65974.1 hypothetical protein FE391_25865 [Nonomuraea sp. KC401]